MRRGRRVALIAGAAAALALASTALAGNYSYQFTRGDQAAAKAGLLRRSDMGAGTWKGGLFRPDLTAPPSCGSYNPKRSDLTVTGAAQSEFFSAKVDFTGEVELLKTAQMVEADWRRTVVPAFMPCYRASLKFTHGRIRSFKRIAFPKVATDTLALRTLVDSTTAGLSPHLVIDVIFIGKGRTEISLVAILAAARPSASFVRTETRLARLLVGRVRT